jgi:hypothetical protein
MGGTHLQRKTIGKQSARKNLPDNLSAALLRPGPDVSPWRSGATGESSCPAARLLLWIEN